MRTFSVALLFGGSFIALASGGLFAEMEPSCALFEIAESGSGGVKIFPLNSKQDSTTKSKWSKFQEDSNITEISVMEGCYLQMCYLNKVRLEDSMNIPRCLDTPKEFLKGSGQYGTVMLAYYIRGWDGKHKSILSLDCSCGDLIINNEKLGKGCKAQDEFVEERQCATLFSETDCIDRNFDSVPLYVNEDYKRMNMSAIYSINVRENCTVSLRGKRVPGNETGEKVYNFDTGVKQLGNALYDIYDVESIKCACGLYKRQLVETVEEHPSIMVPNVITIGAVICLLIGAIFVQKMTEHHRTRRALWQVLGNLPEDFHVRWDDDMLGIITWHIINAPAGKFDYGTYLQINWEFQLFYLGELFEEGAFAQVFKGNYNGEGIAVKKIKPTSLQIHYLITLMNEIKILATITPHPNVVSFIGASATSFKESEVLLLLELCVNKDLKCFLGEYKLQFLDNIRRVPMQDYSFNNLIGNEAVLNLSQLVKWALEIATGMIHVHQFNILHLDLAAKNILLDENFIAKIGDFGNSKILPEGNLDIFIPSQEVVSKYVLSPDVDENRLFSKKSDVFSYGVLLWEMFSLGEDPFAQMESLQNLPQPEHCPLEIYDKLLECWNPDPDERPDFENLHIFFQDYLNNQNPLTYEDL